MRITVVTKMLTLLALLPGVFGVGLVQAPRASAHDQLVSQSPTTGAVLGHAPSLIRLTFSEKVVPTGTQVVVKGPGGEIQKDAAVVSGSSVIQILKPSSPGGYTVTWRATSADGHPVSGSFGYQVSATSAAGTSATAAPSVSLPKLATGKNLVTTTTAATKKVPSDATANHPTLIIIAAVVALLVIGAGAVIARRRLEDDDF